LRLLTRCQNTIKKATTAAITAPQATGPQYSLPGGGNLSLLLNLRCRLLKRAGLAPQETKFPRPRRFLPALRRVSPDKQTKVNGSTVLPSYCRLPLSGRGFGQYFLGEAEFFLFILNLRRYCDQVRGKLKKL
jgi:hypothetical protein